MNDAIFEHIMTRVQEKIDVFIKERDESEFSQGKALAYVELIDAINNTLLGYGIDPKKYGLKTDTDKIINN